MSRAWLRSAPWPGQFEIAGEQYMLRATEAGEMVGRKATRLDAVAPPSYDVSSLRPYVERPYAFGPLTGGMGERVQTDGPGRRYRYAIDADLSVGGVRRLGPKLNSATLPAGLGEVRGFVQGVWGDAVTTFAYGVGGVLRRLNETEAWAMADARVGLTAHQAVRYSPPDGSAGDFLYVAYSDGVLRYYDSVLDLWISATLPAGFDANFVERVRDELWLGQRWGAQVINTRTDPTVAASWPTSLPVGDHTAGITQLRAIDDRIYVFKDDGVYSVVVGALGIETPELFPELRRLARAQGVAIDASDSGKNGRHATTWNGRIWFPFQGGSYALTPGDEATLDRVGLSRLLGNDSEVQGEQTAFAGDQFYGWYAYYDGTSSYLCKHGTWDNVDRDGTAEYVYDDTVINGAVRKIDGRKITALDVQIDETDQPRLWIGYADGGIDWAVLPKNTPDPVGDAECEFVGLGYVYWPDHDADDPANLKHWRGFSLDAPNVDATHHVGIQYRVPPATAWTSLGTDLTTSGQRVDTPGAAVSHTLQVREVLTGSNDETPEVASVILHEQTRPALQLEYDVVVVAADNVARLDGGVDRRTGEQIRAALKATAGPGPTEVWMPDGTRMEVDFVDYGEALAPSHQRNGTAYDVPLKLVEFRTL